MKNVRRLALGLVVIAIAATASGCTSTVSLEPAAEANSVACAKFSVRTPDTIDNLAKRKTDAQATAAWGEPAAVIARCGLPTVTASTLRCISASGLDWLVDDTKAPTYRFISFGRKPATEIIVNSTKASGAAVLDALAPAVGATPKIRSCNG
jgi:uncharacterized protein YceK